MPNVQTWELMTPIGAFCGHSHPTRFWTCAITSEVGLIALSHGATKEESEANARLIAAAPDLLERLKEIKVCLQVALMSFPLDIAKEGMEVVREAAAAISKAEGTDA